MQDLIGKVGICSLGRPGLIVGRKQLPWGEAWVGIGLDGVGVWSSRNPRILTQDEIANLPVPEPEENKPIGKEDSWK